MLDRVLLVDDDAQLLSLYSRQLSERFDITTAGSAEDGLLVLASTPPFAVVLSDLDMPGMNGLAFLAEVKAQHPQSIRMMLTGTADLDATINAINEGSVFRFMTKPCGADIVAEGLKAGAEQYRLTQSERELLEKTLSGSVKLMSTSLALGNPQAYGRVMRVVRTVRQLTTRLKAPAAWMHEIAAMLSHTGYLAVPQAILNKAVAGGELTRDEQAVYNTYALHGADLIAIIPRLEGVARAVKYQLKNYDGSGFPADALAGEGIPIGARLLKLALDYDALLVRGRNSEDALHELQRTPHLFWPPALQALQEIIELEAGYVTRSFSVSELTEGMLIAEDVFTADGTLLASRGAELNSSMLMRLRNFQAGLSGRQIRVRVPVQA